MLNPMSVQCAEGLIDALLATGVKNFVVSPGSRNGPLTLAIAAASEKKLANLSVRLDERSAAFVALGIAIKTKVPTVVVCTSGTAVANLLPALVEAHYSDIPLIALTADRPKSQINTGVSQTIEQENIFSKVTKINISLDSNLDSPERCQQVAREVITKLAQMPQPAHINLHLSEPLVPQAKFQFRQANEFEIRQDNFIELTANFKNKRGLIIAGATAQSLDAYVNDLAESLNWPLIAEPPSLAQVNRISHHPAVLSALPDELKPEALLLVGRVGLSRAVVRLISEVENKIYLAAPKALDAISGALVTSDLAKIEPIKNSKDWLNLWLEVSQKAAAAVLKKKYTHTDILQVITNLFLSVVDNSHIHLSASLVARDFELMLTQPVAKKMAERGITLSMNRGVNGIDGVVSTAYGLALAEPNRQHYCLLGDVAALHDLGGFVLPKGETAVNLHFVIVNNDGGGIFSTLEQAGVENFERVYTTPHGLELDKVLSQLGVRQVAPGANQEIKSAPGSSAQVFNVEPQEKIKEIREEIYSLVKDAI
jgi:2-succinyl-5-enolpyruvyl-6-hydroxy-3-cyclohexene-1-carboxylate synthase